MSFSTIKGVVIGVITTIIIIAVAFFVFDYMRLKNNDHNNGKAHIESKKTKKRDNRYDRRSKDPDSITENTKRELKRKTNKEIDRAIRKW